MQEIEYMNLFTSRRHKRKRLTGSTGAASSANAVNVVFVGSGLIEVNHVAHVWNIESTGGNISRNKHTGVVVAERSQSALPL